MNKYFKNKKGFTLIELLIVIAVLGTLAVVVLVALNPVQQLARTRDAGRSSAVTQMGHAVEAYAVVNNGVYPSASGASTGCASAANWAQCLVQSGEITIIPSPILYTAGGSACTTAAQNGWCYATDASGSVVFAAAEADSNLSRCTGGAVAHFVYSTADGRGGLVCGTPSPGTQTFVN